MKVTLVAIDQHPVEMHPGDFHEHEEVAVGTHVIASWKGVWIDGQHVLRRDRRIKRNRTPGHPWLTGDDRAWTSWGLQVDPNVSTR